MKVKAAVAYAPGQPLAIESVDLDGPKAGEVLVEIRATGDAFDLMHEGKSIRSVVIY